MALISFSGTPYFFPGTYKDLNAFSIIQL